MIRPSPSSTTSTRHPHPSPKAPDAPVAHQCNATGRRGLIAARSRAASVLQRDMYAVGRQLEFQAHIRGQELDDYTVFILEVQSGAPTREGNPGARCDVVSREVGELENGCELS